MTRIFSYSSECLDWKKDFERIAANMAWFYARYNLAVLCGFSESLLKLRPNLIGQAFIVTCTQKGKALKSLGRPGEALPENALLSYFEGGYYGD